MTKQEIFNKVYTHFIIDKNPRAVDIETGNCLYKTEEGYKCAVGLFIPDELYSPIVETYTINDLSFHLNLNTILDNKDKDLLIFLQDLQHCHDNCADIITNKYLSYFEKELRKVANRYKLECYYN